MKPNQKKETDKLYKYFNSHDHRVERVNDVLKELNQVQDSTYFFNTLDMFLKNLKQEFEAKKYKNSMYYCHD